jgi:hypothetical protein
MSNAGLFGVFCQVPRGAIVHLSRHELIHRFPLREIWIELFTELTSPAGLRVVDLSSCRGSYGESIWGSSSLALDFGQHMPRSGQHCETIQLGSSNGAARFRSGIGWN